MRVNKYQLLGSVPLGNTNSDFTYDRLVGIVRYLASTALILGGVLAMGAVVFYGFQMVMSKGDPTKVKSSRDNLIKAAIGAALIFGVFTVIKTIEGAANTLTN